VQQSESVPQVPEVLHGVLHTPSEHASPEQQLDVLLQAPPLEVHVGWMLQ